MDYEIYENDELVNTIRASLEFVEEYCAKNGYTYKLREEEKPYVPPEIPVSAQIQALSDRQDFMEDVLAEFMTTVLTNM